MKEPKNKKIIHLRHTFFNKFLKFIFIPYAYFKYGYRFKRYKTIKKQAYLVLFNHQT